MIYSIIDITEDMLFWVDNLKKMWYNTKMYGYVSILILMNTID